jgi:hypothetical protein
MKKLILLFTVAISLISCSDNTEVIDVQKSDLIGTWNLTDLTSNVTMKGSILGQSVSNNVTVKGKDYNFTFTLSENPDVYSANGEFTAVATTEIAGVTKTEETKTKSLQDLESGDWEVMSDKLIFKGNGESTEIKIVSITETKLVLKQNIDQTVSLGITDFKTVGTATIVLER